ncbi:hypothetical protein MXB_1758 [Myxobolus squamalis]|nr:hypothetical protein MXB_1758 [Myxobolus squamalis]
MVMIDFEHTAYCTIISNVVTYVSRGNILNSEKLFGDLLTMIEFKILIIMALNLLRNFKFIYAISISLSIKKN